jgi:molybdopterin molybdotransferase
LRFLPDPLNVAAFIRLYYDRKLKMAGRLFLRLRSLLESRFMITVETALEIVLGICRSIDSSALTIEEVPLFDAHQRILAEPIFLDRDQPPFDRAMRDGYAIRANDCRETPITFHCVGEVKAGEKPRLAVGHGEAVRIMTGAALPPEADAIVMLEDATLLDEKTVRIGKRSAAGDNVALKASDHLAGDAILSVGKQIDACELAMLASVGCSKVKVFRRAEVSILATGDELREVHQIPDETQIRNSNSYSLWGQVKEAGGLPHLLGIAPDERSALRKSIQAGLVNPLLIVSGGVSMGTYDLVKPILLELGAVIHFESISLRPGKPTVFASLDQHFIFGLPGNPVSTFVTFELFVKPLIKAFQGAQSGNWAIIMGTLRQSLREKIGRTALLPVRVTPTEEGVMVDPVEWRGSADVFSLAAAHGFVVVPSPVDFLPQGSKVKVLMFRGIETDLDFSKNGCLA